MVTENTRRALGDFIRVHRERMSAPNAAASKRRTPGLRREELAEACKVSLTWITWLEQGRNVSASAQALSRLAEALRLGPAERGYLFTLAGRRDPDEPLPVQNDLAPEILALPSNILIPAYLLDRTWTARAWNQPAADLFKGWLDEDHDRNLLRFIFLSSSAKGLIANWDDRARRVVAEFRSDFGSRLHDQVIQALVEELDQASPVFKRLWRDQAVLEREGGQRCFNDPARRFIQTTLAVASAPDIRLVALTPN